MFFKLTADKAHCDSGIYNGSSTAALQLPKNLSFAISDENLHHPKTSASRNEKLTSSSGHRHCRPKRFQGQPQEAPPVATTISQLEGGHQASADQVEGTSGTE